MVSAVSHFSLLSYVKLKVSDFRLLQKQASIRSKKKKASLTCATGLIGLLLSETRSDCILGNEREFVIAATLECSELLRTISGSAVHQFVRLASADDLSARSCKRANQRFPTNFESGNGAISVGIGSPPNLNAVLRGNRCQKSRLLRNSASSATCNQVKVCN